MKGIASKLKEWPYSITEHIIVIIPIRLLGNNSLEDMFTLGSKHSQLDHVNTAHKHKYSNVHKHGRVG